MSVVLSRLYFVDASLLLNAPLYVKKTQLGAGGVVRVATLTTMVGGRGLAVYRGAGYVTQQNLFFCVSSFNTVSGVQATFLGVCDDGTLDAINPMTP